MVVIWSFGLPFLPGYRDAARRGRPVLPRQRPSLNVAVYDEGVPAFYLLQELAPQQAAWLDEGAWRFGDSFIERTGSGRCGLSLSLCCPLPGGGRLEGRVEVEGTGCLPERGRAASPHAWTPLLAPAMGEADLSLGDGRRFRLRGRAYHDRNSSLVPLDALGIDEWFWARQSERDEERVVYALKGAAGELRLALTLAGDGSVRVHRDLELLLAPAGRARFGMPRYRRVSASVDGEPFLVAYIGRPLDDGPFYLRSFLEDEGRAATRGYCEVVAPPRVDLDRHRPLVRMRVHRLSGENSLFLPLLSGPRRGRLARLARHLLGGAGA